VLRGNLLFNSLGKIGEWLAAWNSKPAGRFSEGFCFRRVHPISSRSEIKAETLPKIDLPCGKVQKFEEAS